MKKVIVFGGSGFIGESLVNELKKDHKVIVISRHKKSVIQQFGNDVEVLRLRRTDLTKTVNAINGAKAVINLSGENVGERWSKKKMEKIRKSRLDVDSIIVRAVVIAEKKPEVVLQGSAIGIYGTSRATIDVIEETKLGQRGFLTKVAISHEEAVNQIKQHSRLVFLRTGMVLGKNGGALKKIVVQFKLFLGGKLGNGKQWNSWIHIEDEIRAIRFLIENENTSGPFNLTSPGAVQNKEFSKAVGKILNRPSIMPAPAFILRIFLGTMANELLLNGLKVAPKKLTDHGFQFKFESINDALKDIYHT